MGNIYEGKLYHGTDRKVLGKTSEERRELADICFSVSKAAYELLKAKGIVGAVECPDCYKEQLGDIWWEIQGSAIVPFRARLNGAELFSYGHLYVTNSKKRAIYYAEKSNIYGEQGNIAYLLYKVLSLLNLKVEIPSEYKPDFEKFEKLIVADKCPLIVEMMEVDRDSICFENGNPVSDEFLKYAYDDKNMTITFRLLDREIDLTKDKVIEIE